MAEPNHICKTCGKKYYACDWCAKTDAYRMATCSRDCYQEYGRKWIESHPNVDLSTVEFALPIEIGKTKEKTIQHMQEIKSKPIEQVESETKQELSEMGYAKEVEELGIAGAVEKINQDIDAEVESNSETVNESTEEADTSTTDFGWNKSKKNRKK